MPLLIIVPEQGYCPLIDCMVAVFTRRGDGVTDRVGVGSNVFVTADVRELVGVSLGMFVAVGVWVVVTVLVGVCVTVGMSVSVAVAVGVLVSVGVPDGVNVGIIKLTTPRSPSKRTLLDDANIQPRRPSDSNT